MAGGATTDSDDMPPSGVKVKLGIERAHSVDLRQRYPQFLRHVLQHFGGEVTAVVLNTLEKGNEKALLPSEGLHQLPDSFVHRRGFLCQNLISHHFGQPAPSPPP